MSKLGIWAHRRYSRATRIKKVKQPYFTSLSRDSNSTCKFEVDGELIFPPSLHQCSDLRDRSSFTLFISRGGTEDLGGGGVNLIFRRRKGGISRN